MHERAAREIYERYENTFDCGGYLRADVEGVVAAILREHFPQPGEPMAGPSKPWYTVPEVELWLKDCKPTLVPHAEFITQHLQLAFEKGQAVPTHGLPERYEELRAAAMELAEWRGVFDESNTEQFERIAEMFRKETGMIAPGKDSPPARGDDWEKRRDAFDAWADQKNDVMDARLRTALAATERKEGK